jgi:uncharacterized protein
MRSTSSFILWMLPLVPALIFPGIGVLGTLALVLAVLLFIRESRRPTLALSDGRWVHLALVGVMFGLVVALAFDFIVEPFVERVTGREIVLEGLGEIEGDLLKYLSLLAVGVLFGGVVEELLFRGYVIGWGTHVFGSHWGPWLALLSAVVFGFSHLYQNIAGVITTGLVGLLLGLLYLRMGRTLLPPIVAHMTINAYGITLLYLGL